MSKRTLFAAVVVGALAILALAQAQERTGRREGNRAAGRQRSAQAQDEGQGQRQGQAEGRRGNFDAAQMRERWMNNIKEQLGATDDEWKALSPKIEKVMTAQRDLRTGFGGAAGRRGGEGGAELSKVAQAQRDLRRALDDKATPADEIIGKLAALREARKKASADLEAAQKELKQGLSPRHEAVLVLAGMLE